VIRKFCDACGKEMETSTNTQFSYLCHIAMPGLGGYIDKNMDAVSGRFESADVCHKCYNVIYSAAYETFNSIVLKRIKGEGKC